MRLGAHAQNQRRRSTGPSTAAAEDITSRRGAEGPLYSWGYNHQSAMEGLAGPGIKIDQSDNRPGPLWIDLVVQLHALVSYLTVLCIAERHGRALPSSGLL